MEGLNAPRERDFAAWGIARGKTDLAHREFHINRMVTEAIRFRP
jgi:hypothetical protein